MKNNGITTKSIFLFFPNFSVILSNKNFNTPNLSRQLNVPPKITNKAIIAINEVLSSPNNTKIGESAHFQKGIPPPGTINVKTYVNTIIT